MCSGKINDSHQGDDFGSGLEDNLFLGTRDLQHRCENENPGYLPRMAQETFTLPIKTEAHSTISPKGQVFI